MSDERQLQVCFQDVKRKYEIPSGTMVPFYDALVKKVRSLCEAKVDQDDKLRLVEAVDRTLAKEVLQLDEMAHRLADELVQIRASGPALFKSMYLASLTDESNNDDEESSSEESVDEIEIEGCDTLRRLAEQNEKICNDLNTFVTDTFENLSTTIASVDEGISSSSTIDLIMQGKEVPVEESPKKNVEISFQKENNTSTKKRRKSMGKSSGSKKKSGASILKEQPINIRA